MRDHPNTFQCTQQQQKTPTEKNIFYHLMCIKALCSFITFVFKAKTTILILVFIQNHTTKNIKILIQNLRSDIRCLLFIQ